MKRLPVILLLLSLLIGGLAVWQSLDPERFGNAVEKEVAGLSIVGMNFERAATPRDAILAIDEFRRVQPINYTLVLGEDSVTKQVPKFSGYPTTLFIDGTGTVRMMLVGAHPTETLEAYALVLLAELDSPTPVPGNAKVKRPLPVAIKPGIGSGTNGSGSAPQANPYSTAAGI